MCCSATKIKHTIWRQSTFYYKSYHEFCLQFGAVLPHSYKRILWGDSELRHLCGRLFNVPITCEALILSMSVDFMLWDFNNIIKTFNQTESSNNKQNVYEVREAVETKECFQRFFVFTKNLHCDWTTCFGVALISNDIVRVLV